jgi:hypothetical protein
VAAIWQIFEERYGERLIEYLYVAEFTKTEEINKEGQIVCNSQLVFTLLYLGGESGS